MHVTFMLSSEVARQVVMCGLHSEQLTASRLHTSHTIPPKPLTNIAVCIPVLQKLQALNTAAATPLLADPLLTVVPAWGS